MTRAFVALELPEPVRAELAALSERARAAAPAAERAVGWVAPANLHLTLAFLGEAEDAALEALAARLAGMGAGARPFGLRLAEAGAFPPRGPTRVLWVGLAPPLEPLLELQAGIARACAEAGFKMESRPYSPHLTLGRLRERADRRDREAVGQAWRAQAAAPLRWEVGAFALMRSDLGSGGPRYTRLRELPLGATPPGPSAPA